MNNEGTLLCKYFIANNCTNNNCKFSHSHKLYEDYKKQLIVNKNILCKYFINDTCKNGILCTYSHSEELRKKTLEEDIVPEEPYKILTIHYNYKKIIHDGHCSDVDEDSFVRLCEDHVVHNSKVPHYIKTKRDLSLLRHSLLIDLCLRRVPQGSGECGLDCGFHYSDISFELK